MGAALPIVDLGADFIVTAVHSGALQRCALSVSGNIKCWGEGYFGQLGNGGTGNGDNMVLGDQPGEMGDNLPFVDLGSNFTATALASGDGYTEHNCALSQNAILVFWGLNDDGQLGLGDTDDRFSPETSLIQIEFAVVPTLDTSKNPTVDPPTLPTPSPSTAEPTANPTGSPTAEPTENPTASPTVNSSTIPTVPSSGTPTTKPSLTPSQQPTTEPTFMPSHVPTFGPSKKPSAEPTASSSQELTPQADSTTASPPTSSETSDSVQGVSNSKDLQTRDLWVLIISAFIVSMFLLTLCAVCALLYRSKQQKKQEAEQNIMKIVNVEMMPREQIELEPTFDVHIELEPSLQMESTVVTARTVVDVPVTAGEDQEVTENEEVADWLTNQVGLKDYFSNFWDNGYGSMDIIRCITDKEDLAEIGITDSEHQILLMHHIQKLNSL